MDFFPTLWKKYHEKASQNLCLMGRIYPLKRSKLMKRLLLHPAVVGQMKTINEKTEETPLENPKNKSFKVRHRMSMV